MTEAGRGVPPRTLARVAGWLYLLIIVCAGFAEGYVRATLVVPGDAAATAANITSAEGLFRLGLAADLVAFLADAAVAVLLYVLLAPVSRTLSLLAAAFRLVAHPAIGSLNLLHHLGALLLLTGPAQVAAFRPDQLEALALLSLETHGYGYLVAGAFFGVHCALLGYLLVRSERFPTLLGVLLVAAGASYTAESLSPFVLPAVEGITAGAVVVAAGVAEVSLCLWLIVKGVRDPASAG